MRSHAIASDRMRSRKKPFFYDCPSSWKCIGNEKQDRKFAWSVSSRQLWTDFTYYYFRLSQKGRNEKRDSFYTAKRVSSVHSCHDETRLAVFSVPFPQNKFRTCFFPGTPGKVTRNPHRGNYCWMHGHRVSKEHMSATCFNKAAGHKDEAIFLGGKTCCAFDCTPNVDTAIEDKIKDRQKATLQATRVIHACRKDTILFANKLDNVLVRITLVVWMGLIWDEWKWRELCTRQFSVLNSLFKARVPNQKRPREWRVGLKIFGWTL